jgi:hypothetical protein
VLPDYFIGLDQVPLQDMHVKNPIFKPGSGPFMVSMVVVRTFASPQNGQVLEGGTSLFVA